MNDRRIIRLLSFSAVLLGATSLGALRGWGQQVRATKPTCAACRIERRAVVTLGTDDAARDAYPRGLFSAIRLPNGEFLAAPIPPATTPGVFSADGRMLRVIGRSGRGPAEYVAPTLLLRWRGDSILIGDGVVRRISVLSPRLQYVRSVPMVHAPEIWDALNSDELVIHALTPTPRDSVFHPLHRVAALSELETSFGGSSTKVESGAGEFSRSMATDGKTIWSVGRPGPYTIDRWDPMTGRKLGTIVREVPFFPPGQKPASPLSPSVRPSPSVVGLYYDQGIIWSFVLVAADGWATGLSAQPVKGPRGSRYKVADSRKVYDTIVEAFDAGSGQLLASQRFDEFMMVTAPASRMAMSPAEDGDGFVATTFFAFTLTR